MRRSNWVGVLEVVAFGALAMGCEDVDSKNIKTDGMYAAFSATARGNGETEVRASLRVGGDNGTYVELSPGDALFAIFGQSGTEEALDDHDSALNAHTYSHDFSGIEGNTPVTISFERENDEPAPASITTLPTPFSISGPLPMAEVSRAADLVVTWTPTGGADDISVTVDGDCFFIESQSPNSDTGSVTFQAGTLEAFNNRETETCDGTIVVQRTRGGNVDPAFGEGGHFDGIQERTVTFRSTP